MLKTHLVNNNGYSWFSHKQVHIKGFITNKDNKLIENKALSNVLSQLSNISEISEYIKTIRGVFSIVIESDDKLYLINDITRTFPIFYSREDDDINVSDDISYFYSASKDNISLESRQVFLAAGYTTGRSTLYNNIYQVQAAEIVEVSLNNINSIEYWTYRTGFNCELSFSELLKEGRECLDNLSDRIINTLNGRCALIPLSGGYDSRLIASLLKLKKYKNVECFTYGSPNSKEISVAKAIAKKLGYKCHVIEYNRKFIRDNFDIKLLKRYMDFSSKASSVPHLQDFLAVKYLTENNIVNTQSVFIPGHSGDLFAGTHIFSGITFDDNQSKVLDGLNKKHFSLSNSYQLSKIEYYDDLCFAFSNMEAWSWKERQSKFIVNSIRTYEFFGYKSLIPLWDYDLANFFKTVPLKYKNRRSSQGYNIETNLYDSLCFEVFHQTGVSKLKRPEDKKIIRILRRISALLTGYDGVNNLDLLTSSFCKLENIKTKSRKFNGKVAELYLEILADKNR